MDERQVASVSASTAAAAAADESVVSPAAVPALRTSEGLEPFLADLIRRQCQLVGSRIGIAMLATARDYPTGASARYVADSRDPLSPKQYKRLADIGTQAAREDRSFVETLASATGLLSDRPEFRVLAAPLRVAGKPAGASVCLLPVSSDLDARESLTRLELTGILLEAFLWRQQAYAEAESKIQLRETLDLLDKSHQGHDAEEMAALAAHELQRRFGCSRVSIGLVKGHAVRLVALSGVENLDRRSELAEALEAVMEECADQDVEIRFPAPADADPSERRVVRAHASLSERFGPVAIASFPLRVETGLIGVAVMERDASDPFNDATLGLLRLIAEFLGPTIWTRRLADRGILAVSRDRFLDLGDTMVGPQKTGAKLFALAALLLVLVAVFVPVTDRVVADGRIIADIRRQISAPFVGRVAEVLVKPGDSVDVGQILFRLDATEAAFELARKENERAQLITQADQARSEIKNSDAMQFDAQRGQTEAAIGILRAQIDQADVKSPIAGTVTLGRLDDLVGEVVEPANAVLEIARLDTIRVVLFVNENAVARVKVGQHGRLAVTARPGEKLDFTVDRITPAAEVFEQRNVYRVDASLLAPPDWLRPGMEGKAKVRGGRTNLFTIYTRPLLDALRIRFWWR